MYIFKYFNNYYIIWVFKEALQLISSNGLSGEYKHIHKKNLHGKNCIVKIAIGFCKREID